MKSVKNNLVTMLFISIAVVLVVSGCGSSDGKKEGKGDDSVEIVFSWWTNPDRTEMTLEAIDLFEEKNPNIKVTPQYSGWNEYWEKLATNAVGGGLPDVMQLDGSRIQQYINKNQLFNLNDTSIDVSAFSDVTLDSGKVNGDLYALTASTNAQMLIYNPQILEEADVSFPEGNYTWEEFAELNKEIYEKTGIHGIANEGQQTALLSYFIRSKGESLYSEDGKSIGASSDTIEEWFKYWLDMQETGAVPSAQKSQSYDHDDHPSNPFVKEEAAFAWLLLGTEPSFERDLGKPIERAFLPDWENKNQPYDVHGAMYWGMSSKTENAEAAAKLIDFLVNDPEVAEIFETDRGIPANSDNMELVEGNSADEHVKAQVKFMEAVEEVASPTILEPEGVNEIADMVKNLAENTQAKNLTPKEAAEEFIQKGNQLLNK